MLLYFVAALYVTLNLTTFVHCTLDPIVTNVSPNHYLCLTGIKPDLTRALIYFTHPMDHSFLSAESYIG
jgi:hypothetical protein